MQTCGHWWVKIARKLLFNQKYPQFSKKLSASIACMLATFSMSGGSGRWPGQKKLTVFRDGVSTECNTCESSQKSLFSILMSVHIISWYILPWEIKVYPNTENRILNWTDYSRNPEAWILLPNSAQVRAKLGCVAIISSNLSTPTLIPNPTSTHQGKFFLNFSYSNKTKVVF